MKLTRRAVSEVLQPCGVGVFESRHAPDFSMEWRRHTFLKLIYVRTGEGRISLESRSYPFRDRDIIVVPSGVRNRLIDSPNRMVSLYALCLARELLAFDKTLERRLGQGIRRGDEYLANQAERHLRRLLFQQKHAPERAGLAMVTSALNLLQIVLSDSMRDPTNDTNAHTGMDRMARYIQSLDSHFFEADDIDTAASRLGLSRRAFTKKFRQATGSSWLEYVRARSIEYALVLLRDTEAPIAEVAFECGYNDLSTFYRQFTRRVGTSPTQWRAAHA